MVRRPKILWVDLTVSVQHAELPAAFREACDICACPRQENPDKTIEQGGFNAVCFDLDFPDKRSLTLVRDTKIHYPSLPMLMLTLQHSEALATWAFRTNVIDFLVKPVSRTELHRSIQILGRLSEFRASQSTRQLASYIAPIPPEIPISVQDDDVRLLPALYFVQRNFRFKVRNEVVADLCDMSPFRFSRMFRETYAMTFQDYVIRYRIFQACRLLENPNMHVTDVAYAVGFNDGSYFSRTFKRLIGCVPSDYGHVLRRPEHPAADLEKIRIRLHLPANSAAA